MKEAFFPCTILICVIIIGLTLITSSSDPVTETPTKHTMSFAEAYQSHHERFGYAPTISNFYGKSDVVRLMTALALLDEADKKIVFENCRGHIDLPSTLNQ